MIYRVEQYVNDLGQKIAGIYPADSTDQTPPRFSAQGVLHFSQGDQRGEAPFGFEIDGASVEDAFDHYPQSLELAQAKAKAELFEKLGEARKRCLIMEPPRRNRRVG